NADQSELTARFGIGVCHARRIALVARGNKIDAGLHQSVGNLEIGGAEKGEAAPCAIAGEITRDNVGDNRIAPAHTCPRSDLPALRFAKKALSAKAIIYADCPGGSRHEKL